MAVAFNNASGVARQGGTNPVSAPMSVTAGGSNLCAFACLAWDNTAGLSISSVTYGGVTMTSCGAVDNNGTIFSQVFYLVNPPTGSNSLVVTLSGTPADLYFDLVSFTGVDQTTPVRPATYTTGAGTAQAGTTSYSLVISSDANDLTLSCLNGGLNNVITTNQTRGGFSTAGTDSYAHDRATTAASSVTHTWSGSGSSKPIAIVGFSIQALSSGNTYNVSLTLAETETFTEDAVATIAGAVSVAETTTVAPTVVATMRPTTSLAESSTAGAGMAATMSPSVAMVESGSISPTPQVTFVPATTFAESTAMGDDAVEAESVLITLLQNSALATSALATLAPGLGVGVSTGISSDGGAVVVSGVTIALSTRALFSTDDPNTVPDDDPWPLYLFGKNYDSGVQLRVMTGVGFKMDWQPDDEADLRALGIL